MKIIFGIIIKCSERATDKRFFKGKSDSRCTKQVRKVANTLTILLILSLLTTNIHARISLDLDPTDTDPEWRHLEQRTVVSVAERSSTHGRTESSLYKENKERPKVLPFSLDPHARELTLPAQDDAETLTTLQKFGDRLLRRGIEAGVSTSVNAAVTGRADLGQVGIQTVVKAVGDTLSGMAGDGKEGSSLSDFEHGTAHFGTAAVVAAVTNPDDPFRAAMVAGTSAVVSHKLAESLAPDKPTGLVTEAERTAYNEGVERAANIAKFLTPTLAMLSGQGVTGVSAAIAASTTAVDYNFHPHAADLILPEDQQQQVIEEAAGRVAIKIKDTAIVTAEHAADFWENYGDYIAYGIEVLYCTKYRAAGQTPDIGRLSRLQSRAFAGGRFARMGSGVSSRQPNSMKVSRSEGGAGSSVSGPKVKVAKQSTASVDTKSRGRSGHQARLKELARDDKLGSADRGWIKQEINSIKRGSKRISKTGELKEQKNIRVPIGKELAHRRGKAAKDGYGYEHADLQGEDLHKLQHKHEGYK